MIAPTTDADFDTIFEIINDAARAYEGHIPADRYHVPYMPRDQLKHEIEAGVVFWGYREGDTLAGVMGIQDVADVTLIRHAYVSTTHQGRGVGSALIKHLMGLTSRPTLIGTWANADWAVRFYEKHGFTLVTPEEKDRLLAKYWKIPTRQVETSVVLADPRWLKLNR